MNIYQVTFFHITRLHFTAFCIISTTSWRNCGYSTVSHSLRNCINSTVSLQLFTIYFAGEVFLRSVNYVCKTFLTRIVIIVTAYCDVFI